MAVRRASVRCRCCCGSPVCNKVIHVRASVSQVSVQVSLIVAAATAAPKALCLARSRYCLGSDRSGAGEQRTHLSSSREQPTRADLDAALHCEVSCALWQQLRLSCCPRRTIDDVGWPPTSSTAQCERAQWAAHWRLTVAERRTNGRSLRCSLVGVGMLARPPIRPHASTRGERRAETAQFVRRTGTTCCCCCCCSRRWARSGAVRSRFLGRLFRYG